MRKRTKLTEIQELDLCTKYDSGKFSQRELAKIFNITRSVVPKVLHRNGYKIRPRNPITENPQLKSQLIKDFDSGAYSFSALAKKHGIHHLTVIRFFEQLGHERKKRNRYTAKDLNDISTRIASGETLASIAKVYNTDSAYICRLIQKMVS